ncbi:MAG: zinc metalloprotease, partial [Clostridia bacterium]|nr:zinc metalloprotease [Clostridia bacterium]
VHAKNKPFEEDVDLRRIAQTTVGFTGADLANLLNEAALLAARKGKHLIGMIDIEEASTKIIVGMPKKNNHIKPEEKRKTAYHEAGHAVIAHVLPSLDPVRQISIIPSGRALGYTLTPPTEDKYSVYKNGLKDEICELLGGRVAEKIIFDDISGGASNDIERATAIAKNMVMKLGMSDELGPILYGSQHSNDEVFLGRDLNSSKNYSEETAAKIDAEIKKIIMEAYASTEELLRANIEKLHFIADFLVRNEVMEQDQFERAMNEDVTVEELEEMVAEKRRRSEEENKARAERIKALEAEREAERAAEEAKKAESAASKDPRKMTFEEYIRSLEEKNNSDDESKNDSDDDDKKQD